MLPSAPSQYPAGSTGLPSPEILPAQDEVQPTIGANLAENQELAKAVAMHVSQRFFIPYLMQVERLYAVWNRVDDLWRARLATVNQDKPISQKAADAPKEVKGIGTPDKNDATRAKVSPAAAHKQIDAITNLGVALSFEGGELPVKAKKPKTVYEHPLYNPTQQAVDSANTELEREAREIDLQRNYRVSFGTAVKYGHCFALVDFVRKIETVKMQYVLPPMIDAGLQLLIQLRFKHGGPESDIGQDFMGRTIVTFDVKVPAVQHTRFIPLDCSAVFIDEMIPCAPMERQPCPIVRMHINRWELESNPYDPQDNPFGWQNVDHAMKENGAHYCLSTPDEQELYSRCAKRWGMSDTMGGQRPEDTIKQLWTAYAMLSIDEATGKLAPDGWTECPHCAGQGKMKTPIMETVPDEMVIGTFIQKQTGEQETPCPHCQANPGKLRVPAKRYVVQMFGNLYAGGGVTVLRIQRNPTCKDKVPILYHAHLVEDTATSRPLSKSEVALSAYEQLATAHNQFLDSKSLTIRRPWVAIRDMVENPGQAFNAPDAKIWADDVDAVKRADATGYDDTATLIPYIQMQEKEIQDIFGANDTVVGEISAGRRAASEITLADEGSKRPLVNQVDAYNRDMMGGWGQAALDNLEYWNDRDWMKKRTGRVAWGKLDLFTAVGEEVTRKQGLLNQGRYFLEMAANVPPLQPVIPQLMESMFKAAGMDIDVTAIDQGMKKAQSDAFSIFTRIMGEGIFEPPTQYDPHQIYCEFFNQALSDMAADPDNYWRVRAPQNIPLLMQRLAMQQQLLAQQQMMMMQQAIMEQQMLGNGPQGNGNEPPRGNREPQSRGEMTQQSQ